MSTGFDPLHQWLGIPPDEQPPHCYRLLGLRVFEDNILAIESAADRQTAYLRTLTTGPHAAVAQELLNQVATARTWLLTPDNKAQYDAWLKQQLGWNAASAPPVAVAPAEVREQEAAPDLSDALGGSDFYLKSRGVGTKGRKRQSMGVFITAGAVILALGALAGGAYLMKDKLEDPFSENGTLVVQWPGEERADGVLEVDGARVAMTPGPEIACRLPMGAHLVKCTRPGFLPFEVTMPITIGKTTTLRPIWREAGEKSEPSGAESGSAAKNAEPKGEKSDDFSFDKK